MDLTFYCPHCRQQLEVDASGAGSDITCPTCNNNIQVPADAHPAFKNPNPIASSAAMREERHFSVPIHESPTEILVQKTTKTLAAAKKAPPGQKLIRVRCIRRTDCLEVGHDRFEEVVTDFLNEVGEPNIVSITPVNYSHVDLGSHQLMNDFGVLIVYKG